jgi:hypothetical protein
MNKNTESYCLLWHYTGNFLVKMALKAQKTRGFYGGGRSDNDTVYCSAVLPCKWLQLFGQVSNSKPRFNTEDHFEPYVEVTWEVFIN